MHKHTSAITEQSIASDVAESSASLRNTNFPASDIAPIEAHLVWTRYKLGWTNYFLMKRCTYATTENAKWRRVNRQPFAWKRTGVRKVRGSNPREAKSFHHFKLPLADFVRQNIRTVEYLMVNKEIITNKDLIIGEFHFSVVSWYLSSQIRYYSSINY